jgi:hypothetical protein
MEVITVPLVLLVSVLPLSVFSSPLAPSWVFERDATRMSLSPVAVFFFYDIPSNVFELGHFTEFCCFQYIIGQW